MEKTVAFCTLGCKVNQYESEAVLEQFLKKGYRQVEFSDKADVYVVNTCTVTHLSDRKSRQMIRRAKQENPAAVLAVMGCYAQTNPEGVLKIAEVDIIIGTTHRTRAVEYVESFLAEREPVHAVEELGKNVGFESLTIDGSGQEHTRAYLKVQDGCNQFCSYCIIPYARGRIRSRSIEDSAREAKRLAEAGFCELVLTGIHLASWGRDSDEGTLIDLLWALEQVDGIQRIRLGSLEPTIFEEGFVSRLQGLSKVCHHFHLSLQSGCDETLRRMNRKYTTEEYYGAVERIRNKMPDAALTTDIMVGFPGESDEEFRKSSAFLDKLKLADAHVFKYSPRAGTVAAKMKEQIDPRIKEKRSKVLLELTEKNQQLFIEQFIGCTVPVLFEQRMESGAFEGKTDNYITVLVNTREDLTGQLKEVRLEKVQKGMLIGSLV